MGIRFKIIGLLALVLIGYIALTQVVYRLVILPSYAGLEREEATEDVNRCLDTLWREIKYLDTVAHDWAAWDDTYRFVQQKNDSYRQSNLLQQTFLDNRINAIIILDLEKAVVWGEVLSLKNGDPISLPALSGTALKNDPLLFESRDSDGGVSGIMQTSAGPLLLSCHPITTSDHQSPVRGHLIMGRFLDADYVRKLNNLTHIDHTYSSAGRQRDRIEKLSAGGDAVHGIGFDVQNAMILNGFAIVNDIYGKPALVLKTNLYRHIYVRGTQTFRLTLGSIALVGVVILILMVVLMNRSVIGPLVQLTDRVMAIRNLDAMPPPLFKTRKDEIGILCREFNHMIDQLGSVNEGLEKANDQLRNEIKERKKSERRLLRNQEKLRKLSSQLTLTEERERRQIAADLHDRISQSLALTQIKLGLLAQSQPAYYPLTALEEIENEIDSIIRETRTLTFEISPSILYELGVAAAIEWIADIIMSKHGIKIIVQGNPQSGQLPDSLRVLIFRSVRELLLNVVKHADARHARIRMRLRPSWFEVAVSDDGIGFNPLQTGLENPNHEGFGLFSIKERLSAIGGTFSIHSKPDQGTRITLTIPTNDRK